MKKPTILITGGAGYIGSHAVHDLNLRGEQLLILDNLTTGFSDTVMGGKLVIGDIGDETLVARLIKKHAIDTVIHFAAHTSVPESVAQPLKYYNNNVIKMERFLRTCLAEGIKYFIYSSSAAVYGPTPEHELVMENSPCKPMNPYGRTKLAGEWLLEDACRNQNMRYVILRYFNVAGNDDQLGRRNEAVPGLIKIIAEVAAGKYDHVDIYGNDYPTFDGTGIRDYIHVEDLIDAHIKALDYLRAGGASDIFNCGYGHGYSVKEVIAAMEKISGKIISIQQQGRRAGDPAEVIADNKKIQSILGWRPEHDDLEAIVASAYRWELK